MKLNITNKIQAPSDYDFRAYRTKLQEVENAPLQERKENAIEWFNDLHDPKLIGERIDWLLDGSYGYAEYWKALQILESPRMNQVAALCVMIAILEWSTPQRLAIAAWKKLSPGQQATLKKEIQDIIDLHVDKWKSEGYGGQEEEETSFEDIQNEMNEGAYVIGDTRNGYSVSQYGRYRTTFAEYEDALRFIVKDMRKNKYYPNVFYVNERGNVDLLQLIVKGNKVTDKIIQSWV